MSFKFAELKGAETLPPISIPEGWSEPERKRATTPRGRSASPASRKSPAKLGSESSACNLASEGGKAAFSSLLSEYPDIAGRLDKHPALPANLSQEALDKKALAFAAEYGKKIPESLVLKFLELLAALLSQVLYAVKGVMPDVFSEYKSDTEMINDLKTLIALKFGEFLNIYVVTALKLFVLHPGTALQKCTTPAAATETATPPTAAATVVTTASTRTSRLESTAIASTEKPHVQFPVSAK